MTMQESPYNISVSKFSLEARWRVAQAPNNPSLVLVPCTQLKVHLQRVFGEIYITPPSPLCIPFDCAAPSNQPMGVSSMVMFVLFSSMCEQKVSTYMPSWALLVMTAVCKEVRKKTIEILTRIKQKLKGNMSIITKMKNK
jgi:hypothetical protein